MFHIRHALCAAAVIASLGAGVRPANAGFLETIYAFCAKAACSDGDNTGGNTPLLLDSLGDLYGATPSGGKRAGTVFVLSFDTGRGKWVHTTLYGFPKDKNGDEPFGHLIIDTSDDLYGTTLGGGAPVSQAGVVFEIKPNADHAKWSGHGIYVFCPQGTACPDGKMPQSSGLTYVGAQSGVQFDGTLPLFGTTTFGGANGQGTIFELKFNSKKGKWSETVLHDFCAVVENGNQCVDGAQPTFGPIVDANGNLFGTAEEGANNTGLIYELSPDGKGGWQYTVLYNFCGAIPCGSHPHGGLIADASGNLYGTAAGGVHAFGMIYKLVPNGANSQLTDLYDFCSLSSCADGRDPMAGLAMDSRGVLYGTTEHGGANRTDPMGEGGGTVFEYANGTLVTQYSFCAKKNCSDGNYPLAAVAVSGNGALGTTSSGGPHGSGTVFQLTITPRR